MPGIGIGNRIGGSSGRGWTPEKLVDGHTILRYKPSDANGAVRDINGRESIYWDLVAGSTTLEAEKSSGNLIKYAVYKITATQTNFFYAGCAIGDLFACETVKTCDANNKVQRVLGNHATQGVTAKQFINGVADGVDDFMRVAPIASLIQPVSIYCVVKSVSHFNLDKFFDGEVSLGGYFSQSGDGSPLVNISAGTSSISVTANAMPIGSFHIARICFNGVNSSLQVDENLIWTGDAGSGNMGGLILAWRSIGTQFGNIEFKEFILRDVVDDVVVKNNIYNYFKREYFAGGSGKRRPMIGFICDDNSINNYSVAYPLLESYGFKGGYGIITGAFGEMTQARLIEMQTLGHEIMSHTVTHSQLTTLTIPEVITELTDSKAALEALGLDIHNVVYPGGGSNAAIATEVLKLYDGGFTTDYGNPLVVKMNLPLPLAKLARVQVDTTSLANLKTVVDKVITDDGGSVLFLYGHPSTWDATRIQIITDLFTYIKGKGVVIETPITIINRVKAFIPVSYYDWLGTDLVAG